MLKRELKINLKSFIIWLSVMVIMYLAVFLVYPSIMDSMNASMISEMMEMFPKEVLIAFNMDLASIESVSGWFNTEGYTFLLLVVGIYSAIIGSNILLKEESDKTIEYLYSKPITRNKIVVSKMISGYIYIVLFVLLLTIFNMIGLSLSNDLNLKEFLLINLSTLMPFTIIYFLTMFISTFFNKTKKTIPLSIGIIFIMYFLQILGNMSEKIEFIKYTSVFELSSIRYILENLSINIWSVLITLVLTTFLIFSTIIRYNKKELI